MYRASIFNSNAGEIELNGHEDRYQVISITGLNPAQAQINTIDPAGLDGEIFNSSRLLPRNIVVTLRITGDVEANRLDLYRYFTPGDKVRFLYENAHRNVYIDGTIDTVECGLFTMSEVMQISIVCPDPYFQNAEESEGTWSASRLTFVNDADAETGFYVTFKVLTQSTNIVLTLGAGQVIALQGSFQSMDVFQIDTREDSLGVWIIRGGIKINAQPYLTDASTFPLIPAAKTSVAILAARNGVLSAVAADKTAIFRKRYRGV